MAHVGEKLALGAAGAFGALLGALQRGIRGYELACSKRHLLLQVILMVDEGLVTVLDLREHTVKDIDEPAELVIALLDGASRVVFLNGDRRGGLREMRDWTGNQAL